MPDLGPYAINVLSAYAGSLVLLGAIVWLSFARARRIRAELEKVESSHD